MAAPNYSSASPERFYMNQPPTTETTLWTVPSTFNGVTVQRVKIDQIVLCNNTGATASVSLGMVASGGTASSTNRSFTNATPIQGGATQTLDLSQVMYVGDFISGLQGTSGAITVTICGTVIA